MNAQSSSQDEAACKSYSELAEPETNDQVPKFIADLQNIGKAVGSESIKYDIDMWAQDYQQYFDLLKAGSNQSSIARYQKQIAGYQKSFIEFCSQTHG
ncbi:MAG: hypothetical protein EBS85_03925 [Micrococcales bacterium]|nr:hypothetical protein [Actinomycetota bacterium]NCA07859.1 hypothetical protein [Micrococcales bacterium]